MSAITISEILDLDDQADLPAPRGRRIRIALVSATVGLVLALCGVATALAVTGDHNAWVSQIQEYANKVSHGQELATSAATSVQDQWDNTAITLGERITAGEQTLVSTEGQVADNKVREDLRDALDAATVLQSATPTLVTEPLTIEGITRNSLFSEGSRPTIAIDIPIGTEPGISRLQAAEVALVGAQDAALGAQAQWAYDRLNAAIMNARDTVLPASAGKVADDAVRQALQAAIDAALPASDAGAGMTPVADLIAQRDVLDVSALAVTDAQTAWEAEQARIATERAAEAARQAEVARQAEAEAEATRRTASESASRETKAPKSAAAMAEEMPASAKSQTAATQTPQAAPTQPATPTVDHVERVVATGWQAELDWCKGSVLLDGMPGKVVGEHWTCAGGDEFPRSEGSIVRFEGQGTDGAYRVLGTVAVLSVSDTSDSIPTGYELLYQTCLNGNSQTMAFVALERIS